MRTGPWRIGVFSAVLSLWMTGSAAAGPIVAVTTSGTAGDWTLDFLLTNDVGGGMRLNFFGLVLPSSETVVGTPNPWFNDPGMLCHGPGCTSPELDYFNFADLGGSSLQYNVAWRAESYPPGATALPDQQLLDGFRVHLTSMQLPEQVSWAVVAGYYGDPVGGQPYTGSPLFEESVSLPTVPEPSTLLLMATGASFLVRGYRRRSRA